MRDVTASRVTTVIGLALMLAAMLFGWARGRQQRTMSVAAASGTPEVRALGGSVYAQECAACHGNDTRARASLARITDEFYRRDAGALVDFLLVGSVSTSAAGFDHPALENLSDAQIAALLEYLLAYGPAEETAGGRPPVSADDVASRRRRR